MIKHGKIVVPTDFSEQSEEALRRACTLASQFDAEIHLLHVIPPPVYIDADLVLISPIDAIVSAQHKQAVKRLAEMTENVEANVVTHQIDADSNTAQTICDFCKS